MDSVECTTDPQGISDGGNGFAMNVVVFTSHYEGDTSIYWQLMNDIVNACQ